MGYIIEYMKKSRTKKESPAVSKYDTKISTIEKKYDVDLGVRPDMKFGDYLTSQGYKALADILKN